MKGGTELADVIKAVWSKLESGQVKVNTWQLRTLRAISDCRTAAMGGHIDGCSSCGHIQISYNSCRNRHCPKCQGEKREEWINKRSEELLPVKYFHVVFTLPNSINTLALQHPKELYDLLFKCAWNTIEDFSKDSKWTGASSSNFRMGMIGVLHTWGQNLSLHPHLHCIVPAVGVDKKCEFKKLKPNSKILFPVRAMSTVFRGKFCHALSKQFSASYPALASALYQHNWVVYAKEPFGGPQQVIEYLGRYTHKIAISNQRILTLESGKVKFRYKDYRDESKNKVMELDASDFIQRFSLHILPKRFVRIRHYGILSSTWKREKLATLQKEMNYIPTPKINPTLKGQCPCCKQYTLQLLCEFDSRGPPRAWKQKVENYSKKGK